MRIVDVVVHAWDLAQALVADDQLDADLVAFGFAQAPAFATAPGQRVRNP